MTCSTQTLSFVPTADHEKIRYLNRSNIFGLDTTKQPAMQLLFVWSQDNSPTGCLSTHLLLVFRRLSAYKILMLSFCTWFGSRSHLTMWMASILSIVICMGHRAYSVIVKSPSALFIGSWIDMIIDMLFDQRQRTLSLKLNKRCIMMFLWNMLMNKLWGALAYFVLKSWALGYPFRLMASLLRAMVKATWKSNVVLLNILR